MLEQIKLALRVTTDAFDNEIQRLIDDCIAELTALGVTNATDSLTDPQIVTTVAAYCKWMFGQHEDADAFRAIYDRKLAQFKTMTGHTDWGEE